MSRSGYSEDYDDDNAINLYRANVDRTIAGRRGQQFFRDLVAALEALPEKRLIADQLDVRPGMVERDYDWAEGKPVDRPVPPERCGVCAMGALARARGIDFTKVDPENIRAVAFQLKITDMLAREVAFENDDGIYNAETPEQRYDRMLRWAKSCIK